MAASDVEGLPATEQKDVAVQVGEPAQSLAPASEVIPTNAPKFNIPLAGWILSLFTFIAGTVVPVAYNRLSYDGFSVREPQDVLSVGPADAFGRYVVGTVLKVVNARKDSAILEEINVPDFAISGGIPSRPADTQEFEAVGVDVRALQDNEPWGFPIKPRNTSQDQLPLLIHGESERLVQLQVWVRSSYFRKDPSTSGLLLEYVRSHGLPIILRLDGKNRNYTIQLKSFERYEPK